MPVYPANKMMKISVNANCCELSPIRKFHPLAVAAEQQGLRIFHLNIGQPDLPTPSAFYDAIRQVPNDGTVAYAPSPGMPELIGAVERYYRGIGVDLSPADILITTGGSEALLFTCLSILDPGSEVIVPEPYYPNYATFIRAAGGVIRPMQTQGENGFRYAGREELERMITSKTRAILVTNPGNPTGTVLTQGEMDMLARVAKAHGLYLISDEVYREFCYDPQAGVPTMATLPGLEENLIVIDSVSKRFSACGARVGCAITKNPLVQEAILKFCQARLSVATLDQIGAAALYDTDPSLFRQARAEYCRRRDVVVQGLRQIPGVRFTIPQGAFYLMAALPVDDTDKFQQWLLTEFADQGQTVMFAPGAPFYATEGRGVQEARIAFVSSPPELERAIVLLGLGIAAYNARR